jgi:hypothetical protein
MDGVFRVRIDKKSRELHRVLITNNIEAFRPVRVDTKREMIRIKKTNNRYCDIDYVVSNFVDHHPVFQNSAES